jgi:hypothetical protein
MKRHPDIIATLLIASVLIGTLSFFLPKNEEKYLRDRFWTQKTFASAKYQVIVVGDSRVYRGVSPEVMEKNLPGMKVLNFGYSNGGLNPAMFEAAEEKLSKVGQKNVIVLGVSPNCITAFTQKNEQFQQERTRPREDIFERLYLNGILYQFSATTPEGIRDLLKKKPSASHYRNEYYSNGYVESEKFPVDTMEAISSYTQDFANYKVELQYVERLAWQVKDWSSRGICVVGFRPPASAPMRALEDSVGLYNETIISARFREAGGHWIELKHNRYKTYDGSHLDRRSAILLSNDLAVEIKRMLSPEKKPVQ